MKKIAVQQNVGQLPETLRGWAKVFGFAKDPRSYGRYVSIRSPNGALQVVFEPGIEFAMNWYHHQFRLVDSSKAVVQAFQGLVSPLQLAWWSPDSRIAAVPITNHNDGLLLLDVKRRRYSLILFNAHQTTAAVTSRGVRVSVDRGQFEAIFGKRFPPPRDVFFQFASLRWFAAPESGAWKLGSALRTAPQPRWEPPPSKEMRAYAKELGISLPRAKR